MESTFESNQSTLSTSDESGGDGELIALGVRLLYHPDLRRVGELAVLFDRDRPGEAHISRKAPAFRNQGGDDRGPLESGRISRNPLHLKQFADGQVQIQAAPGLSATVAGKSLSDGPVVLSAAQVQRGVPIEIGKALLLWFGPLAIGPDPAPLAGLLGQSRVMRNLRREILRVSDLPVPVMLRGETGSGKELVASALHQHSPQHAGPYVCVNMAAIPPSMAPSELFGHTRGAFTGAGTSHRGYFADADQGTLFLDEIGETASDVQPMLLRVLETGTVQPLGGRPAQVSVRLLAATDSDLEQAIEDGRFRAPLLRRFGYELHVPPLRERREDIAALFFYFLEQELSAFGECGRLYPSEPDGNQWVPRDFVSALVRHNWPGNVRELRNVTRRFAIHNRGRSQAQLDARLLAMLEPRSAEASESHADAALDAPDASLSPSHVPAADLTDETIRVAMRKHAYSVNPTAVELGVSRSWLHTRLPQVKGLKRAKDLTREEIRRALDAHGGDIRAAAAELEVSARGLQLQITRLQLQLDR